MISYMYIASGQGQTTHWGQNFDVNRKALSLCPFVASLNKILWSLILYIFFQVFIHVYSPRAEADNPLETKFWCQQKGLITLPICCKFKTRGPWATMLSWVNSYKSLIQHFRLSVAMARNQNDEFLCLVEATQQTSIKKKFCQNTCSEIAIKTYFHFSRYKSMETLSCHSNESTWATAIKNKIFVEANVMNISAKFQLHPPYGFWLDDFWIFCWKFSLSVAMATNQIQRFGENSYVW